MTLEQQQRIDRKIDELLELARETGSPMLLILRENKSPNGKGRHLSAYGSGGQIRDMIVEAADENANLKAVLHSAWKKIFT